MNDILIKIGGDITGLSQSLSRAGSQLKSFTNETEQGFQAIGQAGKIVTAAGATIAAGLAASVTSAVRFESAFAGVNSCPLWWKRQSN